MASDRPPSPARLKAQLARIDADLAAAHQHQFDVDYAWQIAAEEDRGVLDVKLAAINATILELEATREELLGEAGAPAPPAPAEPTAAPAVAALEPEAVGTKQAARLLGISPRTLEGLRLRGKGPPSFELGSRVLYPLAELRAFMRSGK